MTDNTKKVHRGVGRVAFLARLADFKRLLDAGHSMRSIYDDHKNQLGIGYSQFTKYVSRYVRKADHDRHQTGSGQGQAASPQIPSPAPATSAGPAQQPTAGSAGAASAVTSPGQRPGKHGRAVFQHNPNSGNDRDDLI